MINLLIIIWVFRKFVFKPYLGFVVEQEKKQKDIDQAADTIARTREEAEKEANKVITDANAQAFDIRSNAKNVAQQQADKLVTDAEDQAAMIKKKAQQDADSMERKVRSGLEKEALNLAMSINKKLFKDKSAANADFITTHSS